MRAFLGALLGLRPVAKHPGARSSQTPCTAANLGEKSNKGWETTQQLSFSQLVRNLTAVENASICMWCSWSWEQVHDDGRRRTASRCAKVQARGAEKSDRHHCVIGPKARTKQCVMLNDWDVSHMGVQGEIIMQHC